MHLLRSFLLLLLAFQCGTVFSQWMGEERIDTSRVAPWKPSSIEAYEQVYEFGEGETRSYLILLHAGYEWHAQTKFFVSDAYGKLKPKYVNFDSIDVRWERGGRFYSNRTNGAFIKLSTDSGDRRGMKVDRYWNGPLHGDDYEIGLRSHSLREFYDGKYTRASRFRLEKDELRELSAEELRIMRNEIFARYGYDFKDGGKMEEHFSQKDWYEPHYEDVKDFLTPVETKNIERIEAVEAEKEK